MMKKKVIVLGGGMVGGLIAGDLSKNYDVTCADINHKVLEELRQRYGIQTMVCDFADVESISSAIALFDFVIGAVPGHLGYNIILSRTGFAAE